MGLSEAWRSSQKRAWCLLCISASLALLSIHLTGCYSFSGASVPPHLKTIAIPLFDDQSGFGEPGLRERFTNKLVERFTGDNTLEVADRLNADSMIEGTILTVRDDPAVVAQGETVTKRRITITVKAAFHDLTMKKKMWEKQLSNWGDYELGSGPAQRDDGLTAAIDKLTEDIVLATVSGW